MKDIKEVLIFLNKKGIISSIANEDELESISKNNSSFYIGVDPTKESLHIGHLVSLILVKLFQDIGMKPIFLLGGFTSLIGDPSGKKTERPILSKEDANHNLAEIKKQIKYLAKQLNIDNFEIIDNSSFYRGMSLVDFFQKYGKHMNLNKMLSKDMVKDRLETGISYTEFSYQLIQSIDFYIMNRDSNVNLQIGGSDQWGNIVSGIDLIRKISNNDKVSGITFNLLTDRNGDKIGKTSDGEVCWLNKDLFSPYQMYQYLINLPDLEARKLLMYLTFTTMEDVELMDDKYNTNKYVYKDTLTENLLTTLYSFETYKDIKDVSKLVFNEEYTSIPENIFDLVIKDLPEIKNNGKSLIEELINQEIVSSKRIFRDFLSNKAIKVNGISITDENYKVDSFIQNKATFISIGKKNKYLMKKG